MPDKEQATKLLGFRDDDGKLVCPADVVDTSKFYTCHLSAEDGSYTPTADEAKQVGALLKDLGLSGEVAVSKGKGGHAFKNKRGVVICRLVEGSAPKKPSPPKKPPLAEVDTQDDAPAPARPKRSSKKASSSKKKSSKRSTK